MKKIIEKIMKRKSIILFYVLTIIFGTTNLIINLAMNNGTQEKLVYSTICIMYVMAIITLTIFRCKNKSGLEDIYIFINFWLNIIIIICYVCSIILLIFTNVYDKTSNFDYIQIMYMSSLCTHLVSIFILVMHISINFILFYLDSIKIKKEEERKREEIEESERMRIDINV